MGITYNIQQRLGDIQSTMEYNGNAVKSAEYVPKAIQANQLPLFVNFMQPLQRRKVADTYYELTRDWTMRLYGRYDSDGGQSENEKMMYDLIDLTYDLFLPKQRLELNGTPLTNVIRFELLGDNSIDIQTYPLTGDDSQSFYVVEFTASVTYRSICT